MDVLEGMMFKKEGNGGTYLNILVQLLLVEWVRCIDVWRHLEMVRGY